MSKFGWMKWLVPPYWAVAGIKAYNNYLIDKSAQRAKDLLFTELWHKLDQSAQRLGLPSPDALLDTLVERYVDPMTVEAIVGPYTLQIVEKAEQATEQYARKVAKARITRSLQGMVDRTIAGELTTDRLSAIIDDMTFARTREGIDTLLARRFEGDPIIYHGIGEIPAAVADKIDFQPGRIIDYSREYHIRTGDYTQEKEIKTGLHLPKPIIIKKKIRDAKELTRLAFEEHKEELQAEWEAHAIEHFRGSGVAALVVQNPKVHVGNVDEIKGRLGLSGCNVTYVVKGEVYLGVYK